jgi:Kef-type K+ transport system membrane component KefB
MVAAILASALWTEWIGIHAVFGAFLLGAMMPHEDPGMRRLGRSLGETSSVLLLPAYFAFSGMRTELGLVNGATEWLWCLIIIAVATVGKFGGTVVAARFVGLPWRDSTALGVLMNTRGLMELIVLNIGLDLGVISPRLFAMLVLMALATTISTTPILRWIGFYTAVAPSAAELKSGDGQTNQPLTLHD